MGAGGKARLTEVIVTDWRPRGGGGGEEVEEEGKGGGETGRAERKREREDADKHLLFLIWGRAVGTKGTRETK